MKLDYLSFSVGFYAGLATLALVRLILSSMAKHRKELLELREKVKKMAEEKPRPVLASTINDIMMEINASTPQKIATLTAAMIKSGPVPDIPQVRWTDEAIFRWLKNQGFDLDDPILVKRNVTTGDIAFVQMIKGAVK